jgi:hypothetical protein
MQGAMLAQQAGFSLWKRRRIRKGMGGDAHFRAPTW